VDLEATKRVSDSFDRGWVTGHHPVWVIQAVRGAVTTELANHANRVTTAHPARTHAQTAMSLGLSLFAIAVGAILKFAVTAQVAGISISTVGLILMVVGGIGLIVSLWLILAGRASAD
jgi:hypothetical protein